MPETLTFDDLKSSVADGSIDTVLACFVDMQGRLMGKRFHARLLSKAAIKKPIAAHYLLATDLEMATPDGYASTSWEQGYGDYTMTPDLSTLRPVPWLEGTAMVLCDIMDHHGNPDHPFAAGHAAKTDRAPCRDGFTATDGDRIRIFPVRKEL